jgi:hypothetical protein
MKHPLTLADLIYQQAHFGAFKNSSALQYKLFQAKRFRLDESMSRFLADLYIAAFVRKGQKPQFSMTAKVYDTSWASGQTKSQRLLIEQLRLAARLPHKVTWVEYDRRAECKRQHEIAEDNPFALPRTRDGVQPPCTEGWLLEQHPTIDTAFKCDLFLYWPDEGFLLSHAWTYYWMCDDRPLPWIDVATPEKDSAWHACALEHYHSIQCGHANGHYTSPGAHKTGIFSLRTGILRHVWSLLATINDIPVLMHEVKATKGFMAHGAYKRFLDHKTIILHVPAQTDRRLLARRVVADVRRRAHMVRGHWRKDWHHLPHQLCEHEWTVDGECKRCKGHRIWIKEHQRGDPAVGILMTDYEVKH